MSDSFTDITKSDDNFIINVQWFYYTFNTEHKNRSRFVALLSLYLPLSFPAFHSVRCVGWHKIYYVKNVFELPKSKTSGSLNIKTSNSKRWTLHIIFVPCFSPLLSLSIRLPKATLLYRQLTQNANIANNWKCVFPWWTKFHKICMPTIDVTAWQLSFFPLNQFKYSIKTEHELVDNRQTIYCNMFPSDVEILLILGFVVHLKRITFLIDTHNFFF